MDFKPLTFYENIAAVVLAAGQSKRMGYPKLVLPWGEETVIGHVVSVLKTAGVGKIVVVTGGAREQVENALQGLPARCIYNPDFEQGMTSSLCVGLQNLDKEITAALVTLGDQPQIEVEVIHALISRYLHRGSRLVVPSHSRRRGHPWLVDRALWSIILNLQPHQTLRDFLMAHEEDIDYVLVDSETVLQDIDTPQDYRQYRPS